MKKYIDFDGVIVDTLPLIFAEWAKIPNYDSLSLEEKIYYASKQNWKEILEKAQIINDSINALKSISTNDSAILTKVNSLENEGIEKIKFLRRHGVKQEVILVPFTVKKTDVVDPMLNILIDDTVHNLDEWQESGGRTFFFSKDDSDIDCYGVKNKTHTKIKTLKNIKYYV